MQQAWQAATSPMEDKWYVATLLIQSTVADNSAGPWTCDEQIRILRASDTDHAYEKALQLGQREEHQYENVYGETVYWKFVGLVDLEELFDDRIIDGTEIKSRLFKSKNPSQRVHPKEKLTVLRWERERRRRAQGRLQETENI